MKENNLKDTPRIQSEISLKLYSAIIDMVKDSPKDAVEICNIIQEKDLIDKDDLLVDEVKNVLKKIDEEKLITLEDTGSALIVFPLTKLKPKIKKWFYIITQRGQGLLISYHYVNDSSVEFVDEEELVTKILPKYSRYINKKQGSTTWVKVYELDAYGTKHNREDLINKLR